MQLRPWKEITIGKGPKTARGFKRVLKQQGVTVSKLIRDLLKDPDVLTGVKKKVQLAVVTPKMLGFENGTSVCEFFRIARNHGLVACPPETGFFLRIQYPSQPDHEILLVVTTEAFNNARGTYVPALSNRFGEKWLNCAFVTPDSFSGENHRWVFAFS